MRSSQLLTVINKPVFTHADINLLFSQEPLNTINTQLARMLDRGELISLKRGLYALSKTDIDEFALASALYAPSYVSLESALNTFGIIPDIPITTVSVSPVAKRTFTTIKGVFSYSKIDKSLYFGYEQQTDPKSGLIYNIALPEKALLDFIYVRRIHTLDEYRFDLEGLDRARLTFYGAYFPKWVMKVIENE